MTLSTLFAISFLSFMPNAYGMFCFPGENTCQVTNNICSVVILSSSQSDACCLSIQSALDSIYGVVTDIDASINTIAPAVIAGTCSCIDQSTQSLSAFGVILKSDIDSVSTKVDGVNAQIIACCNTLSMLNTTLKSDIDSVSTKVDGVNTQVTSCCNTLSALGTSIKSDVDNVSSTLDALSNCLVGTAITQSMIPYTISAPGNYYLCQSVSSSAAGPTITINASNVYFNLNGHTVTNTNSVTNTSFGINCLGAKNIQICNGVLNSVYPAININNGGTSDIKLIDLSIINGANVAILFFNVTCGLIKNCTIDCTNGANNVGTVGVISIQAAGQDGDAAGAPARVAFAGEACAGGRQTNFRKLV